MSVERAYVVLKLSKSSSERVRVLAALMVFAAVFSFKNAATWAQTDSTDSSSKASRSSVKRSTKPTSGAEARTDSTSRALQPELKPLKLKPVVDELSFSMKFESFLNRERPPAGTPDYTQIAAHFRTESEGRVFRGTLELGGSFATAVENYSNIYAPEAFVELQTEGFRDAVTSGERRARLSLGRRLETWSTLDRNWDLGLWEPLNRFDALRPIDQGLTGAFFEAGTGNVKMVVFASPIFIPEQSGSFSLQNGKFVTSNPWFVEPTDRLILFSETTQVQYDLATPSTGSVISHPSGGALIRYGQFENGFYAQGSYAIKPRNQLATPFEGSLNLTDTKSYAAVQIKPQVVYHQLSGAELGYALRSADGLKGVSLGLSALVDAPINEDPGPNLTYQDLDPLLMVSPRIATDFAVGRTSDMQLSLSYLSSTGGGFSMKGPFASDKAVFGPRVPFREAVALDGRLAVGKGQRSTFSLGGRWLEELSEKGSLLSADASLDFSMNGSTQDWRVSLMGDLLGSRLPPNENVGYVSRYRGNDRWMSQLRFIF